MSALAGNSRERLQQMLSDRVRDLQKLNAEIRAVDERELLGACYGLK